MQRLEASGAVRPIYGSLGVRRLSNPKTRRYKSFFATHGILQGLKPSMLSPNALPTYVSGFVRQNLLHAKWPGTKAVSASKLTATVCQLDRHTGCAL